VATLSSGASGAISVVKVIGSSATKAFRDEPSEFGAIVAFVSISGIGMFKSELDA